MRRQEEPQEASAELKHASAPMRSSPLPLQVNPARSTYQHYQPGVHATAGPLPPPPRALFENNQGVGPRPRPPRQRPLSPSARRELDEIKEALQLPNSVSAALAAKVPPPEAAKRPSVEIPTTPAASADGHDGRSESPGRASLPRSIHTREGAFPPSTLYTSPPTQLPVATTNESSYLSHTDDHSIVVVEPRSDVEDESGARNDPVRRSGLELHRENSWVSMSQDVATHNISPNGGKGVIRAASGSHSSSSSSTPSRLPVPPPKTIRGSDDERMGSGTSGLRATLSNLKRFSSLPRTPSPISIRKSPSSRQSCTPSPPVIRSRVSYRPKILCAWPDAMNCQDVVAGRSALERSLGYARKINELAMYDCGLGDWVVAYKGAGMRTTQTPRQILPPSVLSAHAPQPRHTSHGSMASEATFPTRPDAYTATNLSSQTIDVPSPHTPPLLSHTHHYPPPPALAQRLPLGTKSTGFFASISRKTSLRKEKGPLSPPSPGKVLSKRLPGRTSPNVALRSVQVTSPPTIPGGPRAPPGRVQRSKTFSISASPPRALKPDPPPQNNQRQSSVTRRPSLFTRARAAPPAGKPAVVDPEFERQVEKLADLLPHADRNILAGYLRRAGQDILAIGQYLEDEKNGTLRRD
ncbi:hypothetical protein A0H81_08271 [Grifola frondosa]|uniref:Uncharacterized protein n=1 Tax=Grifola frondosa TaxID=5627 RepID=A0A1C7M5J3_GRIFR|nr:hypothetical protein A0H81_08271 [Grifola frondosa]